MVDKGAVLQRLERGEISVAEAIDGMRAVNGEGGPVAVSADGMPVLTRQERLRQLAAGAPALQDPALLAGAAGQEQAAWPWPDVEWQWVWQNPFGPQHIDHAVALDGGDNLCAVFYEGDVRVGRAQGESMEVGGAFYDMRLGRVGRRHYAAASAGSADLSLPAMGEVVIGTLPGDLHIAGAKAQRLKASCQSGACRLENIEGDVDVDLRGSDLNAVDLRGKLTVRGLRAGVRGRLLACAEIDIEVDGPIQLDLGAIEAGRVRCVAHTGDIEVSLSEGAALDLKAEAPAGGVASCSPCWSALRGRSPVELDGAINGGGACVELKAAQGQIFLHIA